MKKQERKTKTAGQSSRQQVQAEKKATKDFNAKLQTAVDGVDWGKVKLPRLH